MTRPTRHGAKQPERFDPARAARLDDPARFAYLEPQAIVAALDLPADATLLDFGAGTGMYAIAIARIRPDVRVLALDEQPAMLERLAVNVAAAGISSITSIGPARLAGLRGSVARIFALNVLHELGDDALTDLGTVLAPDGRALIVDWNADVERPVGPPRAHVYGPAEARARLEERGFRVLDQTPFAYHYALVVAFHA